MPHDDRTSSASLAALRDEVRDRQKRGHLYVQMQVKKSRAPRNWDRVRVFPGVYGRCIGECDVKNVFLLDIPIEPLAYYLEMRT